MRFLLFILLCFALEAPAATLAQLRTRADDWLIARWPVVTNRQAAYFQTHGRYWQGLATHAVEPPHTTSRNEDTVPDRLQIKPHDQAEDWLAFLPEIENVSIPILIRCDVYNGPSGHGFIVTIFAKHDGIVYSRAQNVGRETWHTHGWRRVEAAE